MKAMQLRSANKYGAVASPLYGNFACAFLALVFVAIAWVGSATRGRTAASSPGDPIERLVAKSSAVGRLRRSK